MNEKKKPNPKSYYAFTKYKSEEIVKKYSKKFNIRYGILRYFNVAGASKSGKIGEIEKSHGHLIKNLAIQSTKLNPKVYIFGNNYNTKDGTCIRDYIHVSDLAELHIVTLKSIIHKKKSLILNCGYGKGYSVKEIVDFFTNTNGLPAVDATDNEIARIKADLVKLEKVYRDKLKKYDLDVKTNNDDLCLKLVVLHRVRYNLGGISVGRPMTASLYKD